MYEPSDVRQLDPPGRKEPSTPLIMERGSHPETSEPVTREQDSREPLRREHLSIPATDGAPLAATLYLADDERAPLVVVAPALAVRRSFYDRFARWLRGRGLSALTFDYRGIGGSRSSEGAEPDGALSGWGQRDLAGVLAFARERSPSKVAFVGHSVAGQLLGLAPNNDVVDAAYLVGSPTGACRDFRGVERALIGLAFFVGIPVVTTALGRLPGRLFGAAEDLPASVAREWARWGRAPEGARTVCEGAREGYARVRARACFVSISDDFYGPWSAVDALSLWYEQAQSERRHLVPRDLGLDEIGHFGFFRREHAATLWAEAGDWLERALTEERHATTTAADVIETAPTAPLGAWAPAR